MSSGSRERSAWLCYCVVVMHRDGTPVKRIRRRQKELYHGTAGQGNPGLPWCYNVLRQYRFNRRPHAIQQEQRSGQEEDDPRGEARPRAHALVPQRRPAPRLPPRVRDKLVDPRVALSTFCVALRKLKIMLKTLSRRAKQRDMALRALCALAVARARRIRCAGLCGPR